MLKDCSFGAEEPHLISPFNLFAFPYMIPSSQAHITTGDNLLSISLTNFLASIGLIEIDRYEEDLEKRKSIFDAYSNALAHYSWAEIPVYETSVKVSSYHVYPLKIKGVTIEQRNLIIQKIFDLDVSVNVHFKPLPMLTAYLKRGYKMEDYPVSLDHFSREISLPVYFDLTAEQIKTVVDAVVKSVEEVI